MDERKAAQVVGTFLVAMLALIVIVVFIWGVAVQSNREEFQVFFTVEATRDAGEQALEVPVIVVRVGILRQKAYDSWNHWQSAQVAVKNVAITPVSSLDDAKKESGLIKEAQAAQLVASQDGDALRRACSMLKGEFIGIFQYPTATRAACP
jgi:hypothetical protein